jgi:hypothetical protein
MSTNIITKVTESAARVTGKRWCASHHGEAPADAGSYVQGSRAKRWICDRCQARSQQRQAQIQALKS